MGLAQTLFTMVAMKNIQAIPQRRVVSIWNKITMQNPETPLKEPSLFPGTEETILAFTSMLFSHKPLYLVIMVWSFWGPRKLRLVEGIRVTLMTAEDFGSSWDILSD